MKKMKFLAHGFLLAGAFSLMGLTGCELIGPALEGALEGESTKPEPPPPPDKEPPRPEDPRMCPDFSTTDCCTVAKLYDEYSAHLASGELDAESVEGLNARMACMKPYLVETCGFESLPAERCMGKDDGDGDDADTCDALVARYVDLLQDAVKGDRKAAESLQMAYEDVSVRCPDAEIPAPPPVAR